MNFKLPLQSTRVHEMLVGLTWNKGQKRRNGGEGGIRTPDRAFDPITV